MHNAFNNDSSTKKSQQSTINFTVNSTVILFITSQGLHRSDITIGDHNIRRQSEIEYIKKKTKTKLHMRK